MKKNNDKYMSNISLFLYNICQRHPFIRKFKCILYFIDYFLLLFIRKPKKVKNSKKEVLVLYNYAFGDGTIFMCVGRNLRKIYPKKDYNLTIICQKGLNSLYESYNVFDNIIGLNLTKSTFNIKERFNLYKKLREKYYDIVLDPIGVSECTTNVFMCRALCAKEKISILDTTLNNNMCPKWMYKKIYDKIILVKENNLSLLEYYNCFINGLSNKKFNVELENINSPCIKLDLPLKYFILFPSASTMLKRWPIERYAKILKRVYDKTGLTLVVAGTNIDKSYYDELLKLVNVPCVNIINKTNLMEFVSVIKKSKFVITNDTSVYHIAFINQIPVSVITGLYTYDRYVTHKFKNDFKYKRPYVIVSDMKCANCDNCCKYLTSKDKVWPCLEKVSVDYAWNIIEKMIEECNL